MSNYIPCNRKINIHYYNSNENKAWEEPIVAFEISEDGGLIPQTLCDDGGVYDITLNCNEGTICYFVVDGVEIEYSKRLALRDILREKEEN